MEPDATNKAKFVPALEPCKEVQDRKPEYSLGSALHGTGECKPCAWFWKQKGCQNGAECRHCHLCLDDEIRIRKKLKAEALKETPEIESFPGLSLIKLPQTESLMEPLKIDLGDFGNFQPAPGLEEEWAETEPKASIQEPQKIEASPTKRGALESFAPPPGLAPPSTIPSVGSAAHGTGLCRPCAWLWKPQGCQNGEDCRHCHLCPEGELKARRKVKADHMRQDTQPTELRLADVLLDDDDEEEPEEEDDVQEEQEDARDPFMLRVGEVDKSPSSSPSKLGDKDTPAFVPSSAPARHVFPSEGSALHGTGLCRPCAWFWKAKGCENGKDCRHCHLCLEDEIKNRRKAKNIILQSETQLPSMPMVPPWGGLATAAPMDAWADLYSATTVDTFSESSPASGSPTAVPITLASSLPMPQLPADPALHYAAKVRPW